MAATPNEIYHHLEQRIVGQKDCKEKLSILGYLFSLKLEMIKHNYPDTDLPKLNAMLIGPTGSGKTEMAFQLAEYLNVPFIRVDCTSITPTGYAGNDIEDFLQNLKYQLRDAGSPGIIILDEFDKLGKGKDSSSSGNFHENTQASLLDLLDSRYCADVHFGKHDSFASQERDRQLVNNSLIILSGALDHLFNNDKPSTTLSPGFIGAPIKTEVDVIKWRELLVKEGVMPEIVSRIVSICKTEKLTKDEIKQLLTEKKGSALAKYYNLLPTVEVTMEDIDKLSESVHNSKFGIRDLEGKIFDLIQSKLLERIDITYYPQFDPEEQDPLALVCTPEDLFYLEYSTDNNEEPPKDEN